MSLFWDLVSVQYVHCLYMANVTWVTERCKNFSLGLNSMINRKNR